MTIAHLFPGTRPRCVTSHRGTFTMFDAQHLIDGIVGGTLVKTLDLLRDISHTRIAERLRSELLTDLEFYRKRSIDLEQARIQLGHDLQNAQMWKYNIDAVMARHG